MTSVTVALVTSVPLAKILMSCIEALNNTTGSEIATITYTVVLMSTEEFVNPGEQSVVLQTFIMICGETTKLQFKQSLVNDSTKIDFTKNVPT